MDAQGEQLPDLRKRKPNCLGASNEQEPLELVGPELAIAGRGTLRSAKQSGSLVVANRLRVDAGGGSELTNRERHLERVLGMILNLNPIGSYKVKRGSTADPLETPDSIPSLKCRNHPKPLLTTAIQGQGTTLRSMSGFC